MSDSEKRRFTKINRTVGLLKDLLDGKTHDRRSAAAKLGVQLATADRQLKAIASLPGVLSERRGRNLFYRFDRAALLEPPTLPTTIAACFGATLGRLFEGTAYENAMSEARDHILRQSRRSGVFRHIDRKFVFVAQGGEVSLPEEGAQLDDLIDAVLKAHRVKFEYEDFKGLVQQKEVQPLSLVVYNHQLYLVGREADGTLHPFRFSRIHKVEVDDRVFEYPTKAEYDPAQVFANSLGIFIGDQYPIDHVEIKLHPRWETHVRTHRWHRSQRMTLSKTEIRIHLDVHVCPEVEAWVRGFGHEAEVLKPHWLREKIAKEAIVLFQRYSDGPRAGNPPPIHTTDALKLSKPTKRPTQQSRPKGRRQRAGDQQ